MHTRVRRASGVVLVVAALVWLTWPEDERGSPTTPARSPSPVAVTRPAAAATAPPHDLPIPTSLQPLLSDDAGEVLQACDAGQGIDSAWSCITVDRLRHQFEIDGGLTREALLAGCDTERLRAWAQCVGGNDGGAAQVFSLALVAALARARLELDAADAEATVERFCTETARFVDHPAFREATRSRDAAVFMAGRADWEQGSHPVSFGLLHLSAPLMARIVRAPGWLELQPADYAGLDFGWLRQLLEFDHWSLYGNGPLKDVDERQVHAGVMQIPNYLSLVHWARLRLIKGVHEDDLTQATLEVRHLGQLIDSTGTLTGP